jgi:glutaredoxin
MTTLLSRWARSRTRLDLAHLTVTVYTRSGCCCCHQAFDLLKGYQTRHGFTLEEVDIDADPALVAKYDTLVPVVAVNGKVRFKGVVNPALFERLLLAESRGR